MLLITIEILKKQVMLRGGLTSSRRIHPSVYDFSIDGQIVATAMASEPHVNAAMPTRVLFVDAAIDDSDLDRKLSKFKGRRVPLLLSEHGSADFVATIEVDEVQSIVKVEGAFSAARSLLMPTECSIRVNGVEIGGARFFEPLVRGGCRYLQFEGDHEVIIAVKTALAVGQRCEIWK